MPESVSKAFMSATMTALQKLDGGVRGIATGTSFRRLVAKTVARQFEKAVESTFARSSSPCPHELAQIAWVMWSVR